MIGRTIRPTQHYPIHSKPFPIILKLPLKFITATPRCFCVSTVHTSCNNYREDLLFEKRIKFHPFSLLLIHLNGIDYYYWSYLVGGITIFADLVMVKWRLVRFVSLVPWLSEFHNTKSLHVPTYSPRIIGVVSFGNVISQFMARWMGRWGGRCIHMQWKGGSWLQCYEENKSCEGRTHMTTPCIGKHSIDCLVGILVWDMVGEKASSRMRFVGQYT